MEESGDLLSEKQRRHFDAISSLVVQADRASIRQGVELAAALGDQTLFAALLAGMELPRQLAQPHPPHRRYPTLRGADIFKASKIGQGSMGLAMAHLLAASDLPERVEVKSLGLGASKKLVLGTANKPSVPGTSLWFDGLERLTSLTHLDLHLSAMDEGIDLRYLQRLPSLTHLRLRGPSVPSPLPPLEHLQSLDVARVELESGAVFPALRSMRGRLLTAGPLSRSTVPNLVDLHSTGPLRVEGFERLGSVSCRGDFDASGCQRIGRLRVFRGDFHAPDLRHVGELIGAGPEFDIAQLETLEAVQFNRTTRFGGGAFPPGTALLHPKVSFFGPTLTDLGNVGELPGLEILQVMGAKAPISLETLRHAHGLRVLDIRNSPGVTDLSPVIGLEHLETVMVRETDEVTVPVELADKIKIVTARSANRSRSATEKA